MNRLDLLQVGPVPLGPWGFEITYGTSSLSSVKAGHRHGMRMGGNAERLQFGLLVEPVSYRIGVSLIHVRHGFGILSINCPVRRSPLAQGISYESFFCLSNGPEENLESWSHMAMTKASRRRLPGAPLLYIRIIPPFCFHQPRPRGARADTTE
jgi:hypothetical protein